MGMGGWEDGDGGTGSGQRFGMCPHPDPHVVIECGEVGSGNEAAVPRVAGAEEEEVQDSARQRKKVEGERLYDCSEKMMIQLMRKQSSVNSVGWLVGWLVGW